MTSIVDKYNNYLLLEKGFSDNTVQAYVSDVLKLLNFMEDEGLEAHDVQLNDLHRFAASLYDIGLTRRLLLNAQFPGIEHRRNFLFSIEFCSQYDLLSSVRRVNPP